MRKAPHLSVEIQIAPLIDVCFLLLFFYILTSKPHQPQGALGMLLPGTIQQEAPLYLPDEQRVEILSNGQLLLNEMPLEVAHNEDLSQLLTLLSRYKQSALSNHTSAPLTIVVADETTHQRFVDVLSTCALAGIDAISVAGLEDHAP